MCSAVSDRPGGDEWLAGPPWQTGVLGPRSSWKRATSWLRAGFPKPASPTFKEEERRSKREMRTGEYEQMVTWTQWAIWQRSGEVRSWSNYLDKLSKNKKRWWAVGTFPARASYLHHSTHWTIIQTSPHFWRQQQMEAMVALRAHDYFTYLSRHLTLNQAVKLDRSESIKVVTIYHHVMSKWTK